VANCFPVDILDSGVDWLTMTTHGSYYTKILDDVALRTFRRESERGNNHHGWGMAGFRGWSCGGLQYGSRGHERIARLSGFTAQTEWRRFYALAKSVTRIDWQCTARFGEVAGRRIARHWRAAKRRSGETKNSASVTFITSTDGSSTLYLGKRTSNLYGRIYDKGAESKLDHWANCVRYELEVKSYHAPAYANRLFVSGNPSSFVIHRLHGYFSEHGIDSGLSSETTNINVCSPLESDADRCLAWLRNAVSPSVKRLMFQGRGRELMDALGLRIDQHGDLHTMDDVQTGIAH